VPQSVSIARAYAVARSCMHTHTHAHTHTHTHTQTHTHTHVDEHSHTYTKQIHTFINAYRTDLAIIDHSPPLKTNVALFGFPLNMELLAPIRTSLLDLSTFFESFLSVESPQADERRLQLFTSA
jgi:hypothetical protein